MLGRFHAVRVIFGSIFILLGVVIFYQNLYKKDGPAFGVIRLPVETIQETWMSLEEFTQLSRPNTTCPVSLNFTQKIIVCAMWIGMKCPPTEEPNLFTYLLGCYIAPLFQISAFLYMRFTKANLTNQYLINHPQPSLRHQIIPFNYVNLPSK